MIIGAEPAVELALLHPGVGHLPVLATNCSQSSVASLNPPSKRSPWRLKIFGFWALNQMAGTKINIFDLIIRARPDYFRNIILIS